MSKDKVKLTHEILTGDYKILDQLVSKIYQKDVLDIIFKSYQDWVKTKNMKALHKMKDLNFFNYYSNSMLLKDVNDDEIKKLLKDWL